MTTTAPGGSAGGCLAHHMNEPCAPFVDTLFQESGVELEMAEPFANSREEIASLAVLDGGEPGEIGPLPYWVPSPKLAVGTGEADAGPPSPSRLTLPEPHLPQAVQVVKIEDEVEDEEVAIIADPSDAAAVSTSRSSQAAADGVARPMVGLGEAGPAPFLRKTYEMVSDPGTDPFVSWGSSRNSFVVLDQHEFSKQVLPRYFKHSNFASFVRQLNTYGFRKIDTDRWEFANEDFRGGKKHLLKNIKRRGKFSKQRKTSSTAVNTDYLKAEKEAELETLKKDQEMLKAKILKLREERENSQHEINQVAERVQSAECRQQQMYLFLSKATKYPNFVQHVIQKRRQKRELDTRESSKSSKLLGLDGETTKCLREAMNPKIQSPNVDCLQISDDSAQIESHPNSVVPEDFETIQMHNLWPSMPEQMAGASPSHLSLVFNEMSDKLLGDYVGVGDDAADVEEVEEDLAVNDTRIYLELEGLIEKPCGWSEYTSELVGRAAGLMP